jgi:lipopolysaccharide export LptBFGC system permease protein LptF
MDIINEELGNNSSAQDPEINKYNTEINEKTLKLLQEKNTLKKYTIQTEIDSLNRNKTYYIIKQYIKKFIFYLFLLLLFTLNLISVAIALSVHRNDSIVFKLVASIYAFFFSFLYILLNYRYYRLEVKKEVNTICPNNPFKL